MFENKVFIILCGLTLYGAIEAIDFPPIVPTIPLPSSSAPTEPGVPTSAPILTKDPLKQSEMNSLCSTTEAPTIPHPDDNTQFIYCIRNVGYAIECDDETCFDKQLGVCTKNSCSATSTDVIDKAAKEYCQGQGIKMFEPVSFNSCDSYYICMGSKNEPIRQQCPSNQHFSNKKGECTTPLEAACMDQSKWCLNKQDGLKFAAPKCYNYFECTNQVLELKSCPFNQYFDEMRGKCVNGICEKQQPACTVYDEGSYVAHHECNKFYLCSNNMAIERQCPVGYYFSKIQGSCVRDLYNDCKV